MPKPNMYRPRHIKIHPLNQRKPCINKKVRVVLVQTMMANTGSRGTAPPILNLATSLK